ncbi:DUF6157 family protein [Brachybacterium hainanense]|uniref:DUF6157 family protein n=1 Tax=Brachybacterium hainanense TaxID=1541174 RepID=A0ABV6R736_9MICO
MSTNYHDTFIQVAEDCPVDRGEAPPVRAASPTAAQLQFELLSAAPYTMTSDDLLFAVHALRHGIAQEERERERSAFFARSQACLRASPLPKRYGWGLHHDDRGRVALVASGTPEYAQLAADPAIAQVRAMRSSRR